MIVSWSASDVEYYDATEDRNRRKHIEPSQDQAQKWHTWFATFNGGLSGTSVSKTPIRQQNVERTAARLTKTDDGSAFPNGLLGSEAICPRIETHIALLSDSRPSHPINAVQRARVFISLQQNYGNTYVQRIFHRVQTNANREPTREFVSHDIDLVTESEMGSGRLLQTTPYTQAVTDLVAQRKTLKMPRVPEPARQKSLTQVVEAVEKYNDSKDQKAGQAAVDAAVDWLEGGGTVHFKGQKDIEGLPEFLWGPSAEAQKTNPDRSVEATTFLTSPHRQYKVEVYQSVLERGETAEQKSRYLASIITHEYIHILQDRASSSAGARKEFEAYLWQAENAAALGIGKDDPGATAIGRGLERYYDQLSPREKRRFKETYDKALEKLGWQ